MEEKKNPFLYNIINFKNCVQKSWGYHITCSRVLYYCTYIYSPQKKQKKKDGEKTHMHKIENTIIAE